MLTPRFASGGPLLARLAGERIHRGGSLRICAVDRELLAVFGLGLAVWMYRLPSRDR